MSEPSEASDPCALIGIVKNPDGTITRDPPDSPASQPNLTSPLQSYPKTSSYQTSRGCVSTSSPPHYLNVVVASPSYRLAPEHRLPAAYHDGADALTFIRKSDDEWIKSHVYLFNVFTGSGERCESEIRHENDQVFPPAVGDLCWELCLPVGENRDHAYSNPTMGDGLEVLGALKWKVMVCGGGGDPMIDRQKNVAKLMKEKGINVVERFTDGDVHGAELGDPSKSQTLFASIKSFISSTPYRF
uniref:Alpha/beta hydrolase fold-3 domain-containing protein n=1 Tax=Brassica campestris TaxID=3711 RepID=M4EKG0_BRACM